MLRLATAHPSSLFSLFVGTARTKTGGALSSFPNRKIITLSADTHTVATCVRVCACITVLLVWVRRVFCSFAQVEFLAMTGVFGVIISGAQTLVLEREALAAVEWTTPVVLFTFGYGAR